MQWSSATPNSEHTQIVRKEEWGEREFDFITLLKLIVIIIILPPFRRSSQKKTIESVRLFTTAFWCLHHLILIQLKFIANKVMTIYSCWSGILTAEHNPSRPDYSIWLQLIGSVCLLSVKNDRDSTILMTICKVMNGSVVFVYILLMVASSQFGVCLVAWGSFSDETSENKYSSFRTIWLFGDGPTACCWFAASDCSEALQPNLLATYSAICFPNCGWSLKSLQI